jgi:hypothetical protein
MNIKQTNRSVSGTSFHGHEVTATVMELLNVLGDATERNGDKTQWEWILEIPEKDLLFTVYDWKTSFTIDPMDKIHWHIGGFSGSDTLTAKIILEQKLKSFREYMQAQLDAEMPSEFDSAGFSMDDRDEPCSCGECCLN